MRLKVNDQKHVYLQPSIDNTMLMLVSTGEKSQNAAIQIYDPISLDLLSHFQVRVNAESPESISMKMNKTNSELSSLIENYKMDLSVPKIIGWNNGEYTTVAIGSTPTSYSVFKFITYDNRGRIIGEFMRDKNDKILNTKLIDIVDHPKDNGSLVMVFEDEKEDKFYIVETDMIQNQYSVKMSFSQKNVKFVKLVKDCSAIFIGIESNNGVTLFGFEYGKKIDFNDDSDVIHSSLGNYFRDIVTSKSTIIISHEKTSGKPEIGAFWFQDGQALMSEFSYGSIKDQLADFSISKDKKCLLCISQIFYYGLDVYRFKLNENKANCFLKISEYTRFIYDFPFFFYFKANSEIIVYNEILKVYSYIKLPFALITITRGYLSFIHGLIDLGDYYGYLQFEIKEEWINYEYRKELMMKKLLPQTRLINLIWETDMQLIKEIGPQECYLVHFASEIVAYSKIGIYIFITHLDPYRIDIKKGVFSKWQFKIGIHSDVSYDLIVIEDNNKFVAIYKHPIWFKETCNFVNMLIRLANTVRWEYNEAIKFYNSNGRHMLSYSEPKYQIWRPTKETEIEIDQRYLMIQQKSQNCSNKKNKLEFFNKIVKIMPHLNTNTHKILSDKNNRLMSWFFFYSVFKNEEFIVYIQPQSKNDALIYSLYRPNGNLSKYIYTKVIFLANTRIVDIKVHAPTPGYDFQASLFITSPDGRYVGYIIDEFDYQLKEEIKESLFKNNEKKVDVNKPFTRTVMLYEIKIVVQKEKRNTYQRLINKQADIQDKIDKTRKKRDIEKLNEKLEEAKLNCKQFREKTPIFIELKYLRKYQIEAHNKEIPFIPTLTRLCTLAWYYQYTNRLIYENEILTDKVDQEFQSIMSNRKNNKIVDFNWLPISRGFIAYNPDQALFIEVSVKPDESGESDIESAEDMIQREVGVEIVKPPIVNYKQIQKINFNLNKLDYMIYQVHEGNHQDSIIVVFILWKYVQLDIPEEGKDFTTKNMFIVWDLVTNKEVISYSSIGKFWFMHGKNSKSGYIVTEGKYVNLDNILVNPSFELWNEKITKSLVTGYQMNYNGKLILLSSWRQLHWDYVEHFLCHK